MVRSINMLFTLIVLWFGAPILAGAQNEHRVIKYNWRTEEFLSMPELEQGKSFSIELYEANTYCYEFTVEINQVTSTEKIRDFLAFLFKNKFDSIESLLVKEKPTALTGMPEEKDSLNSTEHSLKVIEQKIQEIDVMLIESQKEINEFIAKGNALQVNIDSFFATICDEHTDRKLNIGMLWNKIVGNPYAEFIGLTNDIKRLQNVLTDLGKSLTKTREQIRDFEKNNTPDFQEFRKTEKVKQRVSKAKSDLGSIESDLAGNTKSKLDTIIINLQKAQDADKTIKNFLEGPNLTRYFVVKEDAESVIISIRAVKKDKKGDGSDSLYVDVHSFPIYQPHRFLISLGWMGSKITDKHFVRANLPDTANTDSAYSTFIDQNSGSSKVVHSPVIIGSVSLFGEKQGLSLLASGGLAYRTVNEKAGLDYLLGFSLGISDMFLVTLGVHAGRVEKLLIGNESEVRGRSTPVTITRENAVGDGYEYAFGMGISYRLK